MMNFLRRLFKKGPSNLSRRTFRAPFSPEFNEPSPLSLKEVYDGHIILDKNILERKISDLRQNYGIVIMESPLRIKVKGQELRGLKGNFGILSIVDERILIVNDHKPYQNVHAYDLAGNHLWDIEGSLDWEGEPSYSFGQVSGLVKDRDGRTLLITCRFPVSYATDLETGTGTRIWSIDDDTDMR